MRPSSRGKRSAQLGREHFSCFHFSFFMKTKREEKLYGFYTGSDHESNNEIVFVVLRNSQCRELSGDSPVIPAKLSGGIWDFWTVEFLVKPIGLQRRFRRAVLQSQNNKHSIAIWSQRQRKRKTEGDVVDRVKKFDSVKNNK